MYYDGRRLNSIMVLFVKEFHVIGFILYNATNKHVYVIHHTMNFGSEML